jgi:hypothetical protein
MTVTQLATDQEFSDFVEWASHNTTEAEKLGYPNMRILKASNGKTLQFAMVHPVAVIEHLASNPEAGRLELVQALKAIVDEVCAVSAEHGIKELFVMTGYGDEKLELLAEHYGFEMVPFTVWRKVL